MSNTRCQPLSWLLVPLALVVLAVLSGSAHDLEAYLLVLLTAIVTIAHLHYGVTVVSVSSATRGPRHMTRPVGDGLTDSIGDPFRDSRYWKHLTSPVGFFILTP